MARKITAKAKKFISDKLASNGLAQEAIKNKDARTLMILAAQACVGVKESGGNNKGEMVVEFQKTTDNYAYGEPWCMAFVQTMVAYAEEVTGVKSSLFSTEHCMTAWRKAATADRVKQIPAPGAIIIWQKGTSESGHTGFVSVYDGKTMKTIEGNTGSDNMRDGDGVYSKTRSTKAEGTMKIVGFIIPFPIFKVNVKPEPVVINRIAGSWEAGKPERKAWTDKIVEIVGKDLSLWEKTTDIKKLHAKFDTLTKTQQIKVILEFLIATAKFESSWNPKSHSVDVGKPGDKGSWSVGLFQMSANDGAAKVFKATFDSLQNPIMNIEVTLEQFRRQFKNTNTIMLDNSNPRRYWAVLLIGNKYSKITQILDLTKKNSGV